MATPTEPTISLNVIIVGGGIAGLTTAYCLGRAGHRITILEQAPWLEEVGAGIQLAPSTHLTILYGKHGALIQQKIVRHIDASRLLVRWGLGSALDAIGVTPEAASFNRCV